jgi:hypothetical protein
MPKKGEFDNLPGSGEPLTLDDDSHVRLNYAQATVYSKMPAVFLLNLSSAEKPLNWSIC